MTFELTCPGVLYAALVLGSGLLVVRLVLRSTRVHRPRLRALLLGLRATALAVVLLILANPVAHRENGRPPARQTNWLLLDTSASMEFGSAETRLAQARRLIAPVLEAPPRPECRTVLATFAADLQLPVGDSTPAAPLTATGNATRLGHALTAVLRATTEQNILNLVVLSDGRLQDRDELSAAVRLARHRGIPVSTYTAGREQRLSNLAILNCIVERHAPPGSRIPVRVVIQGQEVDAHTCRLHLTDSTGRRLADRSFPARNGVSEHVLTLALGNRTETYRLEIVPIPEEVSEDDNVFNFTVEIRDPTVRVLYLEGSNHKKAAWDQWEYAFLADACREAGNIELTTLTVDKQVASGGRLFQVDNPELGYPASREALFAYDLVICSDINRAIFTPEQLTWTVELVADRGGGFCMIGGYTAFGAGGWDKTLWEKMIPMDMQTRDEGYVTETFQPEFPERARLHPLLQFAVEPERNRRILDMHPPFRGTNLVNRAKPGATVLALHPERRMPIITVQPYGRGRAMAFTSDAAGGWGDDYQTKWGEGDRDNRHYRRFWVNAVRWLTENSVTRRGARLVGNTEAISYVPGDTVRLRALLPAHAGSVPLSAYRVEAHFEGRNQRRVPLRLDAARESFEGELQLPHNTEAKETTVVFAATQADGTPAGQDRVSVKIRHVMPEFSDLRADPELLADLARITGGRVIETSADLQTLWRDPDRHAAASTRTCRVPLWDRVWVWCLLVALLSAEWLIRKRLRFA